MKKVIDVDQFEVRGRVSHDLLFEVEESTSGPCLTVCPRVQPEIAVGSNSTRVEVSDRTMVGSH